MDKMKTREREEGKGKNEQVHPGTDSLCKGTHP